MDNVTAYNILKRMVIEEGGCALFGVADVRSLKEISHFADPDTVDKLPFGISIGFRLSDFIIEGLDNGPDRLYKHHYREVNWYLDRIALRVSAWIHGRGYHALPVPASIIVDWKRDLGHLSHKAVGVLAGHGWIGRNILLVNPLYGSRVRYVTVLTDLPVKTDKSRHDTCGDCRKCIPVCPASAIGETVDDFNLDACREQCINYSKRIGVKICGMCLKACSGSAQGTAETGGEDG
jgi:epoxyqueuosine reductase QueG